MALTEPEFWLGSLAFILIFAFSLLLFGNSLNESSFFNLDNDSKTYLANYSSIVSDKGIESRANESSDGDEQENPVVSRLNTIKEFFDVFGVLTLLGNVFGGLWDFFSLAFNLPSFFIETLGLPLGNFRHVVNVISLILSLSATIMLVRLIK